MASICLAKAYRAILAIRTPPAEPAAFLDGNACFAVHYRPAAPNMAALGELAPAVENTGTEEAPGRMRTSLG